MAFEARQSELREMVRTQYPGPEAGTVDEAVEREKEKQVLLEAIERWGRVRAQRLATLAEIVERQNGNAEKDFDTEATTARAEMRSIFADGLRSVKAPTLLGLKIVTEGALAEEKFFGALEAARAVATAMDAIVRYNRELSEKIDALTAKWNESAAIASAIMRDEQTVLDEIAQIMKAAVEAQAARHMNRRERIRAWITATKDAAALATSAAAAAVGVPAPPEFVQAGKEILDRGTEIVEAWGKMAGELESRKARYQAYFTRDHQSLLVMFTGARADARDFLDKHDYTRLVLDWTSKARSAIDALRSAATTAGQKTDADALASRFTSALESAERDAKSRWDTFVSSHQTHFFGAFSPELEKALIGDGWDERYKTIAALDLQGLLQRWIGDEDRDWREIDPSSMPEAWQGELREAHEASLEKLAHTEEEIARNNSPDTLMTWIKGMPAELANRMR